MSEIPFDPSMADQFATSTQSSWGTIGASIGPYRLLEQLGEGGMGEVWLAEQTQPMRRQVALKIIKTGMDTAQVVARFEAERQALARMEHPAIAKVFDAGATSLGRPFFAMEFVRGESLMTHCDRHRLTTRQRLDLFVHICEGVHHAHQKGIIHRDLKPSNILVTSQDDRPVPKIIDFGVAKAVGQSLTDRTLYTSLTGLVGTIEYMSPEQADLGGVDVDTRTDVYSLGVVLYELLTGVLPFESFKQKGLDEIRHTIRDVVPAKPSTRVTQLGPKSAAAAISRGTESSRLASLLRGDLDWITMKAIEKDRARRYGSASELAADIRRHLASQPVMAGPPSARYRTRKFVGRHRFGVGTTAILAVVLIAFAAVMAVQAKRTARERDRANTESAAARQVSDFLVGLFKVSDPSEARGNTLTAREILDKGARDVEKNLKDQPEMQARLQATIGAVYTGLGLYSEAQPLLQRAVENDQRVLGSQHRQTLEALNAQANLFWFEGLYKEAEPIYQTVVQTRTQTLGVSHPDTLRANFDLASLYAMEGRLDDAERLLRQTMDLQRRVLGDAHFDTLLSMGSLASVLYRQKRYVEAEPITQKVLDQERLSLGEQHPETLISMHNLATTYERLDRFKEAEELFVQTIATKRRVLGGVHDSTVLTVVSLSAMYKRLKRYSDAERELLAVASDLETASAAEASTIQMDVRALIALYDSWNRPDKAAEWRRKLQNEPISKGSRR